MVIRATGGTVNAIQAVGHEGQCHKPEEQEAFSAVWANALSEIVLPWFRP